MFYKQCKLIKKTKNGMIQDVRWIPEKYAKRNSILELHIDGEWDDGWKVMSVDSRMDEKALLDRKKAHKKQGEVLITTKYYDEKRLSGTTYRELKRKCFEFGLDYESLKRYKAVKDINKLELLNAVKTSVSIREVLGKLGFDKNHGSKYSAIKKLIDTFDINIDHFTGMLWSKGKTRFTDERINRQGKKTETPWDEAFAKGSSAKTHSLMKRLILSKKREYRCSICGINTWSNKPLRLRLDHIDGDCCNNEEGNLRLLCPNCDAQTDTFCRGKRAKNLTHKWWEDLTDLGVKIKI